MSELEALIRRRLVDETNFSVAVSTVDGTTFVASFGRGDAPVRHISATADDPVKALVEVLRPQPKRRADDIV